MPIWLAWLLRIIGIGVGCYFLFLLYVGLRYHKEIGKRVKEKQRKK